MYDSMQSRPASPALRAMARWLPYSAVWIPVSGLYVSFILISLTARHFNNLVAVALGPGRDGFNGFGPVRGAFGPDLFHLASVTEVPNYYGFGVFVPRAETNHLLTVPLNHSLV